jgi:hypothetical protein
MRKGGEEGWGGKVLGGPKVGPYEADWQDYVKQYEEAAAQRRSERGDDLGPSRVSPPER